MAQIISRVVQGKPLRVLLSTCFSGVGLGTSVLTAEGEIPVEFLSPGDRVITHDAGLQRLERVETRTVRIGDTVRLRPSVLNETGEGHDVLLAARQKLLIRDWRARALFSADSALIEARKLADGSYMTRLKGDAPIRLFQMHFGAARRIVMLGQDLMVASAATVPGASAAQD